MGAVPRRRQVPATKKPLRVETRDGLPFIVMDVEHRIEPGNLEKVADFFVQVHEAYLESRRHTFIASLYVLNKRETLILILIYGNIGVSYTN